MPTKKDLIQRLLETFSHSDLMRLAREAEEKKPAVDWSKEQRKCPRCDHEGPVDPDFGVVRIRGLVRAQSWCKACRSTTATEYRHRPRQNAPIEYKPRKK